MNRLSLVKSLSQLCDEQKHSEEIYVGALVLTRGNVVEISGFPSTGKTSVLLSILAKLTSLGEICAVVDACNVFDPISGMRSGIELNNLLWVRCNGDLEKAFLSADLLVQAKGFGAIWLNLNGLSLQKLRTVPKTYWYRYRTRIKETPTLLFVTSEEPITGSASQQAFVFQRSSKANWLGKGKFKLLGSMQIDMYSRKQFDQSPLKAYIEADQDV
jgi:hypothetical protein